MLEWLAFPFSRGSSQPRDKTWSLALHADSLPKEKSEPQEKSLEQNRIKTYWELHGPTREKK